MQNINAGATMKKLNKFGTIKVLRKNFLLGALTYFSKQNKPIKLANW